MGRRAAGEGSIFPIKDKDGKTISVIHSNWLDK